MKPVGRHKPHRPRANEEERVQRALVQHLRLTALPNVWWCAIPNGGARSVVTGARLKAMGVVAGAPDMVFCVAGRFLALELKTEKGRSSLAQLRAERFIREARGQYRVARGLDEALVVLRNWGVLPLEVSH